MDAFAAKGEGMRYVNIALVVLLLAVLLLFKIQNLSTVTVAFLGTQTTMPASLLIFLAYLLGMLTGGAFVTAIRSLVRGARGPAR